MKITEAIPVFVKQHKRRSAFSANVLNIRYLTTLRKSFVHFALSNNTRPLEKVYSKGVLKQYASKQYLSNVAQLEDMAVLHISYFVMFFSAVLWTGGESCSDGVYPESGFALVDHVFKSLHVDHLVSCYISCTAQPSCQSLNYNADDKTCQLNNDTKYFRPKYFVEKPTFVYAENPSSGK